MKTNTRSRAVAAMLLALAGTAFVSAPATAAPTLMPAPVVPDQLLQRFEMSGVLAVNHQVFFRVYGAPGGLASVNVPGVLNRWQLKEVQPGVYESSFMITPDINPAVFREAVATLQVQGRFVDARPGTAGLGFTPHPSANVPAVAQDPRYDRDARRDRRGPVISDVSPSNGDRVADRGRTRITARFGDDASGIDPRSVSLRVDGRDVTGASRVDGDSIDYREDLAPGRHRAELVVRDRAGNVSRRSWDFDVVGGGRYGYGYGNDRRW